MPHSDSDEDDTLRSGKRYKLGGKKINCDRESRVYIEKYPAGESENYSGETEGIS